MQKLIAIIVVASLVVVGVVVFILVGFMGTVAEEADECNPEALALLDALAQDSHVGTSSLNAPIPAFATSNLTVDDTPLSETQVKLAIEIASYVYEADLPYRAALIALITARQESSYTNLEEKDSDGDSAGAFQQRPNWGSLEERRNLRTATRFFLFGGSKGPDGWEEPGLTDIEDWQTRPPGEVAQAVQVSAHPTRYAEHIEEAEKILAHIGWQNNGFTPVSSIVDCSDEEADRLELAVREALSRVGDEHGKRSGRLLRSVFETVDVTLPAKPGKLQAYTGNPMEGVSAKLLDVSEVKAGDVSLQRGDIVLEEMPDGRLRIGLETGGQMPGSGQPGEVRIATFNLRGSGHTGIASARTRMGISVGFIKRHEFGVVGLQELHGPQRPMLRKRLGDGWGIYPRKKEYGAKGASVNSIIWDRSKFTLLEGRKTPMPYYFGGKRKNIPLVKLMDNTTGQEFWVANTHDPAKGFALLRVKNAREHHRLMQQLTADGTPMFFTGDFNSGFALRPRGGNTTLGHKYKNLAICIMEADGVAQNAYNAFKGRSGQCPEESRDEGKVHGNAVDHVYVSSGVVVSDWQIFRGQTGSDHPVVWADANISGVGGPRAPPLEGGIGAVVTVNDGAVSVEMVRKKRLQAVLRLTITAPPSQTAMAGGLWWPLGGGVKAVQNPSIFADGTTSLAGHPYKAHDISVPEGTDVLAMAPGEVTNISNDACNRKYIQVWSEGATVGGQKGVSLNYFHVKPDVEKGDTVAGGQKIATVVPGFSVSNPVGCASPHLHMEATKTGYRPSCSRDIDCSATNQREFLHMGPELFATWEALKNGAANTGTWVLPINPPYRLTASYGQSGPMWATVHTGQDFSTATGTPVYAVTGGTVQTSYHDSYGNLVQLKLADGTVFYYAHLSAFSVRDGDTVQAGQQLGEVGSTGNSSGPHLHFEVRDASNRHFDPMGLLRQHGLNP